MKAGTALNRKQCRVNSKIDVGDRWLNNASTVNSGGVAPSRRVGRRHRSGRVARRRRRHAWVGRREQAVTAQTLARVRRRRNQGQTTHFSATISVLSRRPVRSPPQPPPPARERAGPPKVAPSVAPPAASKKPVAVAALAVENGLAVERETETSGGCDCKFWRKSWSSALSVVPVKPGTNGCHSSNCCSWVSRGLGAKSGQRTRTW